MFIVSIGGRKKTMHILNFRSDNHDKLEKILHEQIILLLWTANINPLKENKNTSKQEGGVIYLYGYDYLIYRITLVQEL